MISTIQTLSVALLAISASAAPHSKRSIFDVVNTVNGDAKTLFDALNNYCGGPINATDGSASVVGAVGQLSKDLYSSTAIFQIKGLASSDDQVNVSITNIIDTLEPTISNIEQLVHSKIGEVDAPSGDRVALLNSFIDLGYSFGNWSQYLGTADSDLYQGPGRDSLNDISALIDLIQQDIHAGIQA
jgi:hypothetical protein